MPLTINSDSEDDLDYVPPENDPDSDSSDVQDDVENAAETEPPKPDTAEQKKQRDALWATFQASVSTSPSNVHTNGGGPSSTGTPAVSRIKIEKTYLFAGKHVTEVVEVAEDSEEAKEWPWWSPHPPASESVPVPCLDQGDESGNAKGNQPASSPPPSLAVGGEASTATTTTTAPTSAATRPGPRKPRTVLQSIPKASQAKKISTLDKSAMDWRAYVSSQSSGLKDELNVNRCGGGYLEKVDFLKRVEGRREDVFEANKMSKRRKT
ncbi:bucentaur or craniofacial development-domain-containing protein [Chiua virens]|nr:bucentaur or craniofacial development-domain-containing protein [Chiua virens]